MNETLLAALYGRVSTDCQPKETQIEIGRNFAARNGLSIPDAFIFFDDDTSGTIPLKERKEGGLMINALRMNPQIRNLIVAKLDRLGRSLIDLQQNIQELEGRGIRVHFCNLPLPMDDSPIGKLMRKLFLQMLSMFAEFECDMIVQRIRDRMTQKRANGELCGTVPYGWNTVGTGQFRQNKAGADKEIRRLEPNPDEQRWLRKMAELRGGSSASPPWSYQKIANLLNEAGVAAKNGGKWQCGNVAKVLSSRYTQELLARTEKREAA
jgi:site-specific DNA recombinase